MKLNTEMIDSSKLIIYLKKNYKLSKQMYGFNFLLAIKLQLKQNKLLEKIIFR